MLDFKYPTLEDRNKIKPILEESGCFSSDLAFGSLYIWSGMYNTRICLYKDFLFRMYGKRDYCFPLGGDDLKETVKLMIDDAEERGQKFRFSSLTQKMVDKLEQAMPGFFEFKEERNIADYIYNVSDLALLSGRKYHSKRNQVSQFNRAFNWEYEEITSNNKNLCLDIETQWLKKSPSASENGTQRELEAIKRAIDNYERLELLGGIIKIENEPVAFTIGEEINKKVFIVHFEKALPEHVGAYKVINQEFCSNSISNYQYVNREEDLGIEGLRKAKMSYYPSILLNKYSAEMRKK